MHQGCALIEAAKNGHLDVVQVLLTQAGQVITDSYKNMALTHAAKNGHVNVVQALLTQAGPMILDASHALFYAVEKGHLNVVQALLKQAVLRAVTMGWVLIDAVKNGHLDIVHELLAQAGQEISIQYKLDALKKAVNCLEERLVQCILSHCGHELSQTQLEEALSVEGARTYLDSLKPAQNSKPPLTSQFRMARNPNEQKTEQLKKEGSRRSPRLAAKEATQEPQKRERGFRPEKSDRPKKSNRAI